MWKIILTKNPLEFMSFVYESYGITVPCTNIAQVDVARLNWTVRTFSGFKLVQSQLPPKCERLLIY